MKTTNESYQNSNYCTNRKRIKLNHSKSTSRIYKNYLLQVIKKNEQYQRLISLKSFNILLAQRKKITIEKFLINKDRLEERQSINENSVSIKPIIKLIPVTPTTEINTLTNQINRLAKLNSYATFLNRNLEKITFNKYRQTLITIRNKTDLKQRVLNLLLWEKERLIKVA